MSRLIPRRLHALIARHVSHPRGQSLVEFALILPVSMLFFGAVLDLGRIAAAQVTVTNAAREGAFQASKTPTSYAAGQPCPAGGATNKVVCRTLLEAKNSVVTIAPADISLSCTPACDAALGNRISVKVVGHFNLITPILSAFFGGSQNIVFAATSTTQIEAFPPPPSPVVLTSAPPTPSPSSSVSPSPSPTDTTTCSLPSAGFTYKKVPGSGKAPLKVTFTDTSTSISCGITSWYWQSSDGWFSSIQNPATHTYSVPGTYYVTLTVTNAAGSNTTGQVEIVAVP